MLLADGASGNQIGGDDESLRNLISGNRGFGIRLEDLGTADNWVAGNLIGTDMSGLQALGNTGAGVELGPGATGNRIGGDTPGAANIIVATAGRVYILLASAPVVGQGIMRLRETLSALIRAAVQIPNAVGVEIDFASGNVIHDSLIAFNSSAGIVVKSGAGNTFQNNDVDRQNRGVAARLRLGNPLVDNRFRHNERNLVEMVEGTLPQDEIWSAEGDL